MTSPKRRLRAHTVLGDVACRVSPQGRCYPSPLPREDVETQRVSDLLNIPQSLRAGTGKGYALRSIEQKVPGEEVCGGGRGTAAPSTASMPPPRAVEGPQVLTARGGTAAR